MGINKTYKDNGGSTGGRMRAPSDQVSLLDTGSGSSPESALSISMEKDGSEPVDGGALVPHTVQQGLSAIGFGKFHYRLMIVCGTGWIADNMWMSAYSMIVPEIRETWGLGDTAVGAIGSCEFAGMALGALFWGWLSDTVGRRLAFSLTLGLCGVFGVLLGFAPSPAWFGVGICLLGFAIGGNLPVDGSLFAEFMPSEVRGQWLVMLSVFWSVGSLIAASLARAFVPVGWRWYMVCLGLLNIAMCFARIGMPESPVYLYRIGKVQEAQQVLTSIAEKNGSSVNKFELTQDDEVEPKPTASSVMAGLRELFSQGRIMAITTVLLWVIWFCTAFGYTGFNLFVPDMLKSKHIGGSDDVYRDAIIYAAAGIPGSVMGAYFVETRLGRKWTMVISTLLASASLFLFNLASTQVSVVLVTSVTNFFSMIMFAGYYTYTPEVFPTNVRASATGLATACSRVGGILAPIIIGWLRDNASATIPMLVCTVFLAGAMVCMALLPIETRGTVLK